MEMFIVLLLFSDFFHLINPLIVALIHRNAIYHSNVGCSFLCNVTMSNEMSLNQCIWECVNEKDCQTANFIPNENICSLFKERCQYNSIQSSSNPFDNVISYPKNHGYISFINILEKSLYFSSKDPISTCSSTLTTDQQTTSSNIFIPSQSRISLFIYKERSVFFI